MTRALQLTLAALSLAVVAIAAQPAAACMPPTNLDQVDRALSSTRLTGSKKADANALRDYMADAIARRDVRTATNIETQAMNLMGYKEVEGPIVRGGCTRSWVPKAG